MLDLCPPKARLAPKTSKRWRHRPKKHPGPKDPSRKSPRRHWNNLQNPMTTKKKADHKEVKKHEAKDAEKVTLVFADKAFDKAFKVGAAK